ncbi:hypothetical protein Cyrtocomes_01062 [Candidatus Cyrtobacter comes]|uniref:Uncharacterized protein n=1 Tax=Candidatus Cyrtobacter comes TaxID=675776 RepID=A0ABU5L967_9RICK|nr:hypothetical protein [Candidatus Cyrtobacter comes]MDZ5762671.1 hypothetical protein [Candidatus Cyrtobacter comes]
MKDSKLTGGKKKYDLSRSTIDDLSNYGAPRAIRAHNKFLQEVSLSDKEEKKEVGDNSNNSVIRDTYSEGESGPENPDGNVFGLQEHSYDVKTSADFCSQHASEQPSNLDALRLTFSPEAKPVSDQKFSLIKSSITNIKSNLDKNNNENFDLNFGDNSDMKKSDAGFLENSNIKEDYKDNKRDSNHKFESSDHDNKEMSESESESESQKLKGPDNKEQNEDSEEHKNDSKHESESNENESDEEKMSENSKRANEEQNEGKHDDERNKNNVEYNEDSYDEHNPENKNKNSGHNDNKIGNPPVGIHNENWCKWFVHYITFNKFRNDNEAVDVNNQDENAKREEENKEPNQMNFRKSIADQFKKIEIIEEGKMYPTFVNKNFGSYENILASDLKLHNSPIYRGNFGYTHEENAFIDVEDDHHIEFKQEVSQENNVDAIMEQHNVGVPTHTGTTTPGAPAANNQERTFAQKAAASVVFGAAAGMNTFTSFAEWFQEHTIKNGIKLSANFVGLAMQLKICFGNGQGNYFKVVSLMPYAVSAGITMSDAMPKYGHDGYGASNLAYDVLSGTSSSFAHIYLITKGTSLSLAMFTTAPVTASIGAFAFVLYPIDLSFAKFRNVWTEWSEYNEFAKDVCGTQDGYFSSWDKSKCSIEGFRGSIYATRDSATPFTHQAIVFVCSSASSIFSSTTEQHEPLVPHDNNTSHTDDL